MELTVEKEKKKNRRNLKKFISRKTSLNDG